MAYAVGQVLYVVSRRKNEIVPIQIVEELTSKTLTGEEKTYRVRVGEDKGVATIDQIDGEIFESPQEVADVLTERAVASIKRLVNEALQRAQGWYPNHTQVRTVPAPAASIVAPRAATSGADVESQTITLPDGTVARVKLPPELL